MNIRFENPAFALFVSWYRTLGVSVASYASYTSWPTKIPSIMSLPFKSLT